MKDSAQSILVVGTDSEINDHLSALLSRYLFSSTVAESGSDAVQLLQEDNFSAVILDVLLPDMYGIELCKTIRKNNLNIPVIFVSKVNDATEVVLCFEAGTDDYIEFPCNQHILIARIKAKLRDKQINTQQSGVSGIMNAEDINISEYTQVQFGKWTYYPRKALTIHPEYGEIYLTDKESALLKLLLSDPSKTFSRDDIAKYLNLNIKESMTRDVNIHVHRLRNKLTRGHNSSSPIKSVRSQGYTLDSYLSYIYDGKEVSCL